MATESGRRDPSLESQLFSEGYGFEFFEAVRLLERLHPNRQPAGGAGPPSKEAVRFRSHVPLHFPPSAVSRIDPPEDGHPAEMTVAFLGLVGPVGVLPRHYTELVLERIRRKDFSLRDFLDLFHHRLISLFYRAWEKYRLPVAYDQGPQHGAAHDRITEHVFDLFGMGTHGLQGRLDVDDRALLFYSGLLAQHRRSASALESLLADFFGVSVRVRQFVGEWLLLSRANRSRLGLRRWNSGLGDNAVAGRWYWDQQARFTVRLGPLGLRQFADLLPSGRAFRRLVQLVRYFAGQELDFDVQLVLDAADVPRCQLGGGGSLPARLGWCAWLKTDEFERDADEARFGGMLTRRGAFPG